MINKNVDIVAVAVLLVGLAVLGQARRVTQVRQAPGKAVALASCLRDRVVKVPTCTTRRIYQIKWTN